MLMTRIFVIFGNRETLGVLRQISTTMCSEAHVHIFVVCRSKGRVLRFVSMGSKGINEHTGKTSLV